MLRDDTNSLTSCLQWKCVHQKNILQFATACDHPSRPAQRGQNHLCTVAADNFESATGEFFSLRSIAFRFFSFALPGVYAHETCCGACDDGKLFRTFWLKKERHRSKLQSVSDGGWPKCLNSCRMQNFQCATAEEISTEVNLNTSSVMNTPKTVRSIATTTADHGHWAWNLRCEIPIFFGGPASSVKEWSLGGLLRVRLLGAVKSGVSCKRWWGAF